MLEKWIKFWLVVLSCTGAAFAQNRQAPPGMFKDLDDEILGEALVIHGKQLFIDNYVIDKLDGVEKRMNRAVKHPANPIIRRDRPSDGIQFDYGTVAFDPKSQQFQMWYQAIQGEFKDHANHQYLVAFAVSDDGITWTKPVVNDKTGTNLIVMEPPEPFIGGPGVMIDPHDPDPNRRYKMLYIAKPDGKASSLAVHAAYSPDGIHWRQESKNPLAPFSDTQVSPYWDVRLQKYVAYLRFGPPNIRHVSRIESADFTTWSPKLTVLKNNTKLDAPYATEFYTFSAMPYAGVYLGLLNTYHGETIQPIPKDKPWMDRVDNQLAFSRNGVTWQRVAASGVLTSADLRSDRDWQKTADEATFLAHGSADDDWDWGQVYPHHPPLVVGDEIRIYYGGTKGRHWAAHHKDPIESGIGLATLRLDGFVSVDAGEQVGTLTTKPFVFFGDMLEINANAAGGTIQVEALDADGKPIPGFKKDDSDVINIDNVRQLAEWKGDPDCHLLQGRPIRLRFYLRNAKLYAFEPRIRKNHYLQSYD